MARIGVALSGGGHRATVFAFGVLMYLIDAGKQREIAVISSVSGGSIANGILAQNLDVAGAGPKTFREAIRPAVRNIAHEGLFFWSRQTNMYVVTLFAALAVGVFLPLAWVIGAVVAGWSDLPGWLDVAALIGVVALVVGLWLFSRRSVVVERALDRLYFHGSALSNSHRAVQHVFCATELQSGEHAYLAPTFVYSYRFGTGAPNGLPLARAVQCSACLPFAFAPRRLPAEPLFGRKTTFTELVLSDGGVYDNMADQWLTGAGQRHQRPTAISLPDASVDDVIIVNAGGVKKTPVLRLLDFPGIGEVRTLRRVNELLYAGTTSYRRRELVRQRAAAILQSTQTPYTVAERIAEDGDARGRAALAHLARHDPYDKETWTRRAAADASVRTSLGALGPDVTADLLEHAYYVAMYGLHVLLGYPLLKVPARAEFDQLTSRDPGPGNGLKLRLGSEAQLRDSSVVGDE